MGRENVKTSTKQTKFATVLGGNLKLGGELSPAKGPEKKTMGVSRKFDCVTKMLKAE